MIDLLIILLIAILYLAIGFAFYGMVYYFATEKDKIPTLNKWSFILFWPVELPLFVLVTLAIFLYSVMTSLIDKLEKHIRKE